MEIDVWAVGAYRVYVFGQILAVACQGDDEYDGVDFL